MTGQDFEPWASALATIDRDGHMNCAYEACGKWARDPHRIAMDFIAEDGTSRSWTYREIEQASGRLAQVLLGAGLRRGDRVVGILSRQVEAFITALAAVRVGMLYAPVYVGFGSDAILQRLEAVKASAVVLDATQSQAYEQARSRLSEDPVTIVVSSDGTNSGVDRDWDFWAKIEAQSTEAEPLLTSASDPAFIMFTSGTTGPPKKCVMPHTGYMAMYPLLEYVVKMGDPDDSLLFSTGDPGWGYGLFTSGLTPMSLGYRRVLFSGRFDPERWAGIIGERAVTTLSSASSAYRRLGPVMSKGARMHSAFSAGENLDADTFKTFYERTGVHIINCYGQTEVGMPLSNMKPSGEIASHRLVSNIPGYSVELHDDSGAEVQVGDSGEIVVRLTQPAFQMSMGYEDAGDAWERRWQGEFFRTGDRARLHEGGELEFLGRGDDLIVTSGYNVGPSEVEEVILAVGGVVEAAVLGESDEARGQIVHAFVIAQDGRDQADLEAKIVAEVRAKMGRHAYPRRVTFLTEIPKNPAGKVLRRELSKMAQSTKK